MSDEEIIDLWKKGWSIEKIENRIRKEREEQQIKEERRLKRKIARIKYQRRKNK